MFLILRSYLIVSCKYYNRLKLIRTLLTLSLGNYVYLFRQAISKAAFANKHLNGTNIGLYVDGNILCNRFILLSSILISLLKVWYRRSG